MIPRDKQHHGRRASSRYTRRDSEASVLVMVLWISFGLVSITLYFANSMNFEMRAAENRVAALQAEQAINGAARYVSYLVANLGTNGALPDTTTLLADGDIGDGHYWLIGRDTNNPVGPGRLYFGLVDEASKINLNTATSNMLAGLLTALPQANFDLVDGIQDWRSTNGGTFQTYYGLQAKPYMSKSSPFETVDELRLVYGGDLLSLVGEDVNRNGVLDSNELDQNRNGMLDPGVLDYVTVYTREPNTRTNGSPRVQLQNVGNLRTLLSEALGDARSGQILALVERNPASLRTPLRFYNDSGMTADEFAKIANDITTTNAAFIEGRVNVNTASAVVLGSLPGMTIDLGEELVNYRQSHPEASSSIAWVKDALSSYRDTLAALSAVDCLTAQSYQFSADIVGLGAHGRGYQRTRFVFDTSEGTPKIIYRQDLSHLGWALGKEAREAWRLAKSTR